MSIHCFLLPDCGHTATRPLKSLSLCLPWHCIILICERRQTPLPWSCFCQGISSQQEEGTNKSTEINPMAPIGEPFESESLPHLYCVTRQGDGTRECDPGAVWLQSHSWEKAKVPFCDICAWHKHEDLMKSRIKASCLKHHKRPFIQKMEQWANWQVTMFQHLLLRSLWPGTSYIISLSHLPNKEVLPNGLIISSFSEHRATLWHICHSREMRQWHKKSERGALESAAPSVLLGC